MNELYDTPSVRDFGTVADLTRALGIGGIEDGASKAQVNHHDVLPPIVLPSIPLIP
jgi:hypothetical protein